MGNCKVCEVLERENEHLRKWIDRLMDSQVPDPEPQESMPLDKLNPEEDAPEMEQFGD